MKRLIHKWIELSSHHAQESQEYDIKLSVAYSKDVSLLSPWHFDSKYHGTHEYLLFANHRLCSEINDGYGSQFYKWWLISGLT